jgi:CubicO group peptidase (beta-lactamase class C family)
MHFYRSKKTLISTLFSLALLSPLVIAEQQTSVAISTTVVDNNVSLMQFSSAVSNFMHTLNNELNIKSGTAIAVVQNDQVIYQQNFGLSDIDKQLPVNNDSLFYIASITKPLFALAMLNELQTHGMGLQTSLATLFPDLPLRQSPSIAAITVEQLLSHTSDLENNNLGTALAISGDYNDKTIMALLNTLKTRSDGQVNSFEYTNLGYNILSLAFERNFHTSWQAALAKDVFAPLSMQHTSNFMSDIDKYHWQMTQPYSFFSAETNKPLYLTKQDNTMHAAGGTISTSTDMAIFLLAQINQGKLHGQQVIPSALIAETQKIRAELSQQKGEFSRTGYALGWYTGEYKSHLLYHHFGRFDGYRPHLSFMPDTKIGLVILNNEGDLNDKITGIIADLVYSTLLGEANAEQRLTQRIAEFKSMALVYREKVLAKEAAYDQRPPLLSLDPTLYSGIYSHELMGKMRVELNQEGRFVLQWGNLHSLATGMPEQDFLRIKFLPTSPQKVSFKLSDNHVVSLSYDGMDFIKLPNLL